MSPEELKAAKALLADPSITVSGKSLLHSAALTTRAFSFSYFGEAGQYIVALLTGDLAVGQV